MNHREHGEYHTAIMGAVACLQDADGETIEAVIRLLGMTEQLTRQLVMTANEEQIEMLLEEKRTTTQTTPDPPLIITKENLFLH